ncbi:MAG: ATP-binding cassette domain-containing protein [Verrucomicrobiales bacterium]
MNSEPLLKVDNLCIRFRLEDRPEVEAVKDASFELAEQETLAIVGESGSGKSVTALALTRLLPEPPALITGSVRLKGRNTLHLSERELRSVRGREIAYIFQDPMTSLNPVFSIRWQLAEMIKLHRRDIASSRTAIDNEILYWLNEVGILNPRDRLKSYPHELSGGMQQRVMIAMALCARPSLLVADEPTTALDATVQKQIIDLLARLRAEHRMAILMITHNFHILRTFAHRVVVMFRGQMVETGDTEAVLSRPQHPYTRALIDCVPRIGAKKTRLASIDYALLDN